ncbi:MAG: META domain-containing protein [bacterium]|nr:META domain-containing protein [bacterium]
MRLAFLIICTLLLVACNKKADPPKETVNQVAPQKPAPVVKDSTTKDKPMPPPTETAEPIKPELKKAKPSESPIKNKRWKLLEMDGEKVEVTEAFKGEPHIILSLQSNKIHGSGGCNRFGGIYALEGEKLTFSGIASTKMLCEGVMEVEDPYMQALATVNGYRVNGDAMWLLRDGKQVMKFEAVYTN